MRYVLGESLWTTYATFYPQMSSLLSGPSLFLRLAGDSWAAICISSLCILRAGTKDMANLKLLPNCTGRGHHINCKACSAAVDSRNSTPKPSDSQALRVIVVVHLLLASPWLCALGRALVVAATTLSVVGLSSIIGLRGTRILQTLRVVGVQFLANERLLALGASRVALAAALAV
jgi:hypothetical protein